MSAWTGENNTRASLLRYVRDYPLFKLSIFRIKSRRVGNEKRASSNRDHRRQRPISDGRGARCARTQDRDSVWYALRHARWRKSKRASGLFFAATRPGPSNSAARNKSPGQHLRAALAQRPLDYLGSGGGQSTGKICAARCVVAFAVL